MPEFVIASLGGFATNFKVEAVPPYTPSDPEKVYLARLHECIAVLSDLSPRNGVVQPADLVKRKEDVRDRALRVLRTGFEAFAAKPAGATRDASTQAEVFATYRIEGRYREWMARIETAPFTIVEIKRPIEASPRNPKIRGSKLVFDCLPEGERSGPNQARSCDLQISTRDVYIHPDKGALKVEIDNALNVTKTVFFEREASVSWIYFFIFMRESRIRLIQARLHEYMVQLAGIAGVGLVNQDISQAPFAQQDLVRYKNEFTLREAGAVKNHYVRRLGLWCFFAAVPLSLLYMVGRASAEGTIIHDFRNFFVLLVGAVCGTWISFLIRRADLKFDDLATLEEDRLNPGMRVLFMIGLTVIVGLLFWAQAVIFVVGEFTSSRAIYSHGAWTLLLGLLIGVAERTMGTAVAKHAGDLPAAVASATPTVTAQR